MTDPYGGRQALCKAWREETGSTILADVAGSPAGQRDEVRRRQAEDSVRRSRRRPDAVEGQEIGVDQGDRRLAMSDRRHAADGEPGALAHEIRIGPADPLPQD